MVWLRGTIWLRSTIYLQAQTATLGQIHTKQVQLLRCRICGRILRRVVAASRISRERVVGGSWMSIPKNSALLFAHSTLSMIARIIAGARQTAYCWKTTLLALARTVFVKRSGKLSIIPLVIWIIGRTSELDAPATFLFCISSFTRLVLMWVSSR